MKPKLDNYEDNNEKYILCNPATANSNTLPLVARVP